jgi:hypothetical protein
VLVSEQDIDYLLASGYELSRVDPESIGRAVSAFLSDSVLLLAQARHRRRSGHRLPRAYTPDLYRQDRTRTGGGGMTLGID